MTFSTRRGSSAVAVVMLLVAMIVIIAGIVLIGAGTGNSNPCLGTNPPSDCYIGLNSTSTGSGSSTTSSSASSTTSTTSTTTSSTTSTNSYTTVTTLTSPSTEATFITAVGYASGIDGCSSPIGPYPAGCNNKALSVSFTLDGTPEGNTPQTLGIPTGKHVVVCGAAPPGYVGVLTTINFNVGTGTEYVTCQYETTPTSTTTTTTTGPSSTGSISVDVNVQVVTRYGNSMVSNDKITAVWNGGSTSASTGPNGEVAVLSIPINAGQTTFTDSIYQRSAVYTIGASGFSFTLYYVVYLSTFNFLGLPIDAATVANIGYGLVIFGAVMTIVAMLLYHEMGKSKGVRHG